MATITSSTKQFQCAHFSESSTDARNKLIDFLEQYKNHKASAQANEKVDSYVSYYYQNLYDEFSSENYEELIRYNRKSVGLYSKIINEIKEDSQNYLAFNMGRLIGSSQITNKYVNMLYTQLLAISAIDKVTNSKDLLKIIDRCYKEDKAYNQDLCDLINSKPNNLTKKMKTLMDLDLVTRHQAGKKVYYTLTAIGKIIAEELRTSKPITNQYVSYTNFFREPYKEYMEAKPAFINTPSLISIKNTKETNTWGMINYAKNN